MELVSAAAVVDGGGGGEGGGGEGVVVVVVVVVVELVKKIARGPAGVVVSQSGELTEFITLMNDGGNRESERRGLGLVSSCGLF